MKRIFIIILLGLTFYTGNLKAGKAAVLISAGIATQDDEQLNSEYWYDLFLAYEYLYFVEGLSHSQIIVLYGNGGDFNSNNTRYQKSYHSEWASQDKLVDYRNDFSVIDGIFATLGTQGDEDDTLIIRWVFGHGSDPNDNHVNDPDDYWALIENRDDWIPLDELIQSINQTDGIGQRFIQWMTCHSGCLLAGNQRLDNEKTTVFTSCFWEGGSATRGPTGEHAKPSWDNWHGEFNYWFTGFSAGHAPGSSGENEDLDADLDEDGTVSIMELYRCVLDSVEYSTPQIGGADLVFSYMYDNLLIDSDKDYLAPHHIIAGGDNYNEEPTSLTINYNASVTMACKTGYIQLKPGFHAREGCEFVAKIDPDLYSTSSNDFVLHEEFTPDKKATPNEEKKDNSIENKKEEVPAVFSCSQNYPNPLALNTTIKYGLPKKSNVNLTIFNLAGQAVRTLVNGQQPAGFKSARWEGRTDAGREVPQGIYFYTLKAGDEFKQTYKMIVVK